MVVVARARNLVIVAAIAIALPLRAQERVDTATIERIKTEAMQHSQIMDILSWLTDVHGPRLTNSPLAKEAGDWAVATLKQWGLANVHYEWWPFGRGWSVERFTAEVVAPHHIPLIAYLGAWSDGTNGLATGDVVRVTLDSMKDLDANRGKLRGKWLILASAPPPPVRPEFAIRVERFSDSQLDSIAHLPPPGPVAPPAGRGRGNVDTTRRALAARFRIARAQFLLDEGVLGILQNGGPAGAGGWSTRDFGTVQVYGTGSRAANAPRAVPTIMLAVENYGQIWRMLDRHVPVTLEVNAQVTFHPDTNAFNIIGEIPGTDPRIHDEVVMIGAHFDSFESATGATDNGAGTSVMMEAMRILKTLNLKPRRTIRIGLWTGEEQGLFGSAAYVRAHFGYRDSTGFHPTAEQAKFSAYFNLDHGAGKVRGIYLQGNAAMAPIFDAWLGPFKAGGTRTISIANTGGTDHLSFDGVGLPGFEVLQDPLEYGTRSGHTNQDLYERVPPEDMKWNAAILATFAWQAAQRDDKLPRKAER